MADETLTSVEESKLQEMLKPQKIRSWAIGIAIPVIIMAAAGGTAFALLDPPEHSDYVKQYSTENTPALASSTDFSVEVHDPHNVLSSTDEQRLRTNSEVIEVPDVVSTLMFLVFEDNWDNINDSVEEYLKKSAPGFIDGDYFADGLLIVGVGLDPRQSFVASGEDVADALRLHPGKHLDDAVYAIQPNVEEDDIPAGLLTGAETAMDTSTLAEDAYADAQDDYIGSLMGATGLSGALGAIAGIYLGKLPYNRRRKELKARAEYDILSKEYGNLAKRLDEIDIRAHSLSSALVDAELRKQWHDVKERFLSLHDDMERIGTPTSTAAFLEKSDEIHEAALSVRHTSIAEGNINTLFKIERGDAEVRRTELNTLREDITEAQSALDDANSGLYAQLSELKERTEKCDVRSPQFIDHFVMLLKDYNVVLETYRKKHFDDVAEDAPAPHSPAIFEREYRPGSNYYINYIVLSSWHSDHQQSTSSGTNNSFSSGFSGNIGSAKF